MKNKVAFGPQARRIASVVSAAAIVGVMGVGGLTLSSADVSAASRNTGTTSSSNRGTTSSNKNTTGTGTTSIPATSAGTTTTTTTATTPTQTSTTPNTGIFTGDDEFTKADGLVILTASLTVLLAAYLLIRNRKNIFRGRVNFGKR